MASLFHLIFEFVRISILALVYGYLIWIIVAKVFKKKGFKKRYIVPIIFVGLFIWRLSYWRNNGFGDFGRVPLSSEYEVTMIDFWYANIEKNDSKRKQEGLTSGMEKLYMEDGLLYGQTNSDFLIFDSDSGVLKDGLSEQEFETNKGMVDRLVTPDKFHGDYWGWKILLY